MRTFHLLMGLCFARGQECQRRLKEGGTRHLPCLIPDARRDLGCQCQRRDKRVAPEIRQGSEMVSSHLLTQKLPSVPAALMEKADFHPSPRWQSKSKAVVPLPPGQGGFFPKQHLRMQHQKSHTVGFPPTCRIPVQLTYVHCYTAYCQALGVIR